LSTGVDGVRIARFPFALRLQDRTGRVIRGAVKRAIQRRVFDEEVVDEQLPALGDVDHGRRGREIRRLFDDTSRRHAIRRPR